MELELFFFVFFLSEEEALRDLDETDCLEDDLEDDRFFLPSAADLDADRCFLSLELLLLLLDFFTLGLGMAMVMSSFSSMASAAWVSSQGMAANISMSPLVGGGAREPFFDRGNGRSHSVVGVVFVVVAVSRDSIL